jgi:hypothetical protein
MKFAERGSAVSRRLVILFGLVAMLVVAPVASAQEDQFMFKSDVGFIQWQVKADKAADFESSWIAIRTKLSASEKPELKALGSSLTMFKVEIPPQNVPGVGNIAVYYFVIDPTSKTNSYDPSKLLYETGDLFPRAEADTLFNKLAESLAGIGPQPLRKLQ